MMTVLLILLALVVAGAVVFFLMKSGKIEDKDGNNIPDAVEEKLAEDKEVAKVVKERAKRAQKVISSSIVQPMKISGGCDENEMEVKVSELKTRSAEKLCEPKTSGLIRSMAPIAKESVQ